MHIENCRWTAKGLLAYLTLLVSAATSLAADEKLSRPNILFIFTDDQTHRSVGCYDEAFDWVQTPNIDRLAAEGVRFRHAYANGSWCLPSRATVLTGLHPHGIQGMKVQNNPEMEYDPAVCRFWPAALRKAGYTTGQIGKWHLGPDTGFGRDWEFQAVWNHAVPGKAGGYYVNQALNFDGGPFKPVEGYSTDNYTRFAEEFIRRKHEKPWFLWLCYGATHGPYTPAERHQSLYQNNEPVPTPSDIFPPRPTKPAYMHNLSMFKRGPDGTVLGRGNKPLAENVRQYQRVVSGIDENVGRLLKTLRDEGQLENTLVVYTADQGFAWGQHGFQTKLAPYDANLRIPFIVRMPRTSVRGKVCERPVCMLDLVPTFFALAGAELPWTMPGHDLAPLLKDPMTARPHPVMVEFFRWEFGRQTDRALTKDALWNNVPWWVFLRDGNHKYIRTLVENEIEELYDLESDPEELHNLALESSHRDRLHSLRKQLTDELTRTEAGLVKNLPEPRVADGAPGH